MGSGSCAVGVTTGGINFFIGALRDMRLYDTELSAIDLEDVRILGTQSPTGSPSEYDPSAPTRGPTVHPSLPPTRPPLKLQVTLPLVGTATAGQLKLQKGSLVKALMVLLKLDRSYINIYSVVPKVRLRDRRLGDDHTTNVKFQCDMAQMQASVGKRPSNMGQALEKCTARRDSCSRGLFHFP